MHYINSFSDLFYSPSMFKECRFMIWTAGHSVSTSWEGLWCQNGWDTPVQITSRCTPKRRKSRGMTHGQTLYDIDKKHSPWVTKTGLTLTACVGVRCELTVHRERKTVSYGPIAEPNWSPFVSYSVCNNFVVIFIHVSKQNTAQNTCNSINSQAQHTYVFYLKHLSIYFLLRHHCQGQSCTRDSTTILACDGRVSPWTRPQRGRDNRHQVAVSSSCKSASIWILSLSLSHTHTNTLAQKVRTEPASPTSELRGVPS